MPKHCRSCFHWSYGAHRLNGSATPGYGLCNVLSTNFVPETLIDHDVVVRQIQGSHCFEGVPPERFDVDTFTRHDFGCVSWQPKRRYA